MPTAAARMTLDHGGEHIAALRIGAEQVMAAEHTERAGRKPGIDDVRVRRIVDVERRDQAGAERHDDQQDGDDCRNDRDRGAAKIVRDVAVPPALPLRDDILAHARTLADTMPARTRGSIAA
jgi:hypothetical protein